eukprot:CFRG4902T1
MRKRKGTGRRGLSRKGSSTSSSSSSSGSEIAGDSDSYNEKKMGKGKKYENKKGGGRINTSGLFEMYVSRLENHQTNDINGQELPNNLVPSTVADNGPRGNLSNRETTVDEQKDSMHADKCNIDKIHKKEKKEKKEKKKAKKKLKKMRKKEWKQEEKTADIVQGQLYDLLTNGKSALVPHYYNNAMKSDDLIKLLASTRNWSEVQVQADLRSLHHNRLYTVGDLRSLTEESWKIVELLPLVKDLISRAIDLRRFTPLWTTETQRNGEEDKIRYSSTSSLPSSSSSSVSKQSSALSVNATVVETAPKRFNERSTKTFTRRLGRRMVVHDGRRSYEVDRYCPHKGVDMMGMPVRGGVLTCTKHDWKFDLKRGGMCARKGKSVNAVCISADPKLQW